MVLNGDDLYGREDLAKLAACRAGILASPVDNPKDFGIIRAGPMAPSISWWRSRKGFPSRNWPTSVPTSSRTPYSISHYRCRRNEYEITDAVSMLAKTGRFDVVEATYWLPIGTVEAWTAAQTADVALAR